MASRKALAAAKRMAGGHNQNSQLPKRVKEMASTCEGIQKPKRVKEMVGTSAGVKKPFRNIKFLVPNAAPGSMLSFRGEPCLLIRHVFPGRAEVMLSNGKKVRYSYRYLTHLHEAK